VRAPAASTMVRRPGQGAGFDNRGMTLSPAARPGRDWPIIDSAHRCPCLSGEQYGSCCEPFHLAGTAGHTAPTAERLMRSRYSAYVVGNARYLLASWHPTTRPAALDLDPTQRWLSLEILGRERGGMMDREGTVHFRAHYVADGQRGSQDENSRFLRVDGRWVYLDAL
jgi:SEC-C motif-containing protein